MEEIRVLLVESGEKPRLVTMEHTLENLQKTVGGHIQAIYPDPSDPIAIICDDEGKFKGYPVNRMLLDDEGEPYDFIAGNFFICGLSAENFASISDEMADKYTERFYWPEMLLRTLEGHVMWIRLKPGEEPKLIV
ncbi:MAG: DUF3846 domain-containing protein [Lachnospiraceae bacterium]|nr:DUF3846 domain-containing protein [Lachnospiraceae bacterium]